MQRDIYKRDDYILSYWGENESRVMLVEMEQVWQSVNANFELVESVSRSGG
jgi:hypothetical protein